MRLEDEIKQKKPFNSEYNKMVVNLIYTYNWLEDSSKVFFEEFDITSQQFNILRILKGQQPNPSTINLLKDRMLDKMCDASRLVDRLLIKGLVERTKAASDKRAVDIHISKKGEALLSTISLKMPNYEKKFNTLSEQETKDLNNLLDKLRG
jgi:DNA-binding MarR family transcriptional regulator